MSRLLTSVILAGSLVLTSLTLSAKPAAPSERWTLQQWLEQKNRMRMMDMWLMMNAPSPFEFKLGGQHISYSNQPATDSQVSYDGHFSAFATVVGLTIEHENNVKNQSSETSGLLNFRLLGDSLQNSHLLFSMGQRTFRFSDIDGPQEFRQTLGQGSIQLYFTQHFGLSGTYRSYLSFDKSEFTNITGDAKSGGVFIDFDLLRLSLSYFYERTTYEKSLVPSKIERSGLKSGLFFYF
mgnify:CR=1 FL=1